ncbi:MAG TPA: lactate utilization protein C [Propionibacteriaceae bacterium]|nr:lactate utilization protein C [Propionibacteriaceae bacterium]
MSARDEILARVRDALSDVTPAEADVEVPWEYGRPVDVGEVVETFVERVEDYRATVVRCTASELPRTIAVGLAETGADTAVVPVGLDPAWLAEATAVRFVSEDAGPLGNDDLNRLDAVVTAAAVGIAETGTIVLDHGPDQGRRALTLVPDRHVCVVRSDQVVSGVPEAVSRLRPSIEARRPLTWISGPSATSDIELSRVEGVHGPRQLYVIVVD